MTPQVALAATIRGAIDDDRIHTVAGLVYVGITGKVRLQQHGRPVVDLGTWRTPTAELAAAYWTAVAA